MLGDNQDPFGWEMNVPRAPGAPQSRVRRLSSIIGLLFAVGWASSAQAHPFGSGFAAHELDVWLSADTLHLRYQAEIPTQAVLAELRVALREAGARGPLQEAAFVQVKLDELEGSLRVLVDGAPLALARLPGPPGNGKGDARFIRYSIEAEAPLPAGARTLTVVNGNYPDGDALFSSRLWVSADVRLDETTLLDVEGGQIRADRSGQWRADEASRELRASFYLYEGGVAPVRRQLQRLEAPDQSDYREAGSAWRAAHSSVLIRLLGARPGLALSVLLPILLSLLLALRRRAVGSAGVR